VSNSEDTKKVRRMLSSLGAPPPPDAVVGNLAISPSEQPRPRSNRTEQLNLRVPPPLKKRVRLLATRDDISLSELIIRAIALYEEKHGPAPDV
jgi:hypothetical protein